MRRHRGVGDEPGPGVRARLPRGRRARGESGQALVEFLVVVPALLLVFFGIVELGGALRTYQVITNTAREGARVAVIANSATQAETEAVINDRLTQGGLDPGQATVEFICPAACFPGISGSQTEVRISYPHTFVLLGPIVEMATGGGGDNWGTITMRTGFVMRHE